MSTSIYINSLIRFDEDKQVAFNPSPFEFTIPSKVTGNWNMERRPFSRTALTKVTDSFQVKVCRVLVPKSLMPEQKPLLQLQLEGASSINRAIGPNIKNFNMYGYGASGITGLLAFCIPCAAKPSPCCPCGVTGVTGVTGIITGVTGFSRSCIPPSGLNSFNETWPLYPTDCCETATHWIYGSCSSMAINEDFRKKTLILRLRDEAGYVILPFGFTEEDLCAFNKCFVTTTYAPLFLLENQLMVVLNAEYIENDALGLEECF